MKYGYDFICKIAVTMLFRNSLPFRKDVRLKRKEQVYDEQVIQDFYLTDSFFYFNVYYIVLFE